MSQLQQLQNKIFSKKQDVNIIADILELVKELHCLPEIIGRNYEVRDAKGTLVYTIKQKPMTINQLRTLVKQLGVVHERETARTKKVGGLERRK